MTSDDLTAWTIIHICGRMHGQAWHTTMPAYCFALGCSDWALAADTLRGMVDGGLALIYRWIPDGNYASRVPVSSAGLDAVVFHGSFLVVVTPRSRALFEKVLQQARA
jgi:hypothetical protein